MTLDWLSGLVCGFVAAWFFLRGESPARGHQVRNPHSPVGQRRPDPPPAPPKPTPPAMRERTDRLWPAPHVTEAAVAYCESRGRGVYCVSSDAGVALPSDQGRC